MKFKLLTLALSMALLASCSSTADETPDTTTPDTTTPDTTTTAPAPGVTVPDAEDETPAEDDLSGDTTPEEETTEDEPTVGDTVEIVALEKSDFTFSSVDSTYKLVVLGMGDIKDLVFTSDNEEIATVAEDGTVTAVGPGNTNIKVAFKYDGEATTLMATVRCNFEAESTDTETAPETTPDTTEPAPDQGGASVDLTAFYQSISGYEGMAGLMQLEGEMLDMGYAGLSGVSTKQSAVYAPMMTAAGVEVALVEVSDPSQVATVKAIFQGRINAQIDGGAWYPETIEAWQNHAKVVSNGNYVMMICHPSSGSIISSFNGLF